MFHIQNCWVDFLYFVFEDSRRVNGWLNMWIGEVFYPEDLRQRLTSKCWLLPDGATAVHYLKSTSTLACVTVIWFVLLRLMCLAKYKYGLFGI